MKLFLSRPLATGLSSLRRKLLLSSASFLQRACGLLGFRTVSAVVSALRALGIGVIIYPVWTTVLRRMNRRKELVRWTGVYSRRKHPRYLVNHLRALILATRFEDARAYETFAMERIWQWKKGRGPDPFWRNQFMMEKVLLDLEFAEPWAVVPVASPRLAEYFYRRVWEMHVQIRVDALKEYALKFMRVSNYQLDFFINIHKYMLQEYGINDFTMDLGVEIYKRYISTRRNEQAAILASHIHEVMADLGLAPQRKGLSRDILTTEVLAIFYEASLQTGNSLPEEMERHLVSTRYGQARKLMVDAMMCLHPESTDQTEALLQQSMSLLNAVEELPSDLRKNHLLSIQGMLAVCHEMAGRLDAARALYRLVAEVDSDRWLDKYSWRYASLLLANPEGWPEVTFMLLQKLRYFWNPYRKLARRSPEKRIRQRRLVLPRAVILVGRGLGDVILQARILQQLRPSRGFYIMGGDPRLKPYLEPGNEDWLQILPCSQTRGPFAVSEREYWEDREGVPATLDHYRVTRPLLDAVRKIGDVMLGEDLFVANFLEGPHFTIDKPPLVKLSQEEIEQARAWVDSLPGRVKVAFSWRSGHRSKVRDLSYTTIEQWADVLRLEDVTFISVQYSDTSEEMTWARKMLGVEIHQPPGIDLTNDLRAISAIMKACDITVAPCTAVREMAGACGARSLSLDVTPVMPDLWRIREDGRTDRFYPQMEHVTIREHGSVKGVIEACGRKFLEIMEQKG